MTLSSMGRGRVHDTQSGARRAEIGNPVAGLDAAPVTPPRRDQLPDGATGFIAVDLAQLRANWKALAAHVAPAECGAVVKANAYGVGAHRVVPALFEAGCRSFFVATLDEATKVRPLAPGAAIYVLDGLLPHTARELARLGAVPVLTSLEEVRTWASLARERSSAPPAALHVDTGLNRLGMSAADASVLARDPVLLRRLGVSLVMSHLACADTPAHPMNREQLDTFTRVHASFPATRASLAASDGLLLGPDYHFDLVRPGYALYGGQAAPGRTAPVAPVVRVSAMILQVQEVAAGARVGYAASYRAASSRRIATIAAGYADGVFRHASASNDAPGGVVAIGGRLAPIVGRVSMDLITVDVTDLGGPEPKRGDWADLVSPELPLEAVGVAAGSIGYEVLTRLGPRFHRIYLDHGA
jgi:alanine racemase